MRNLKLAIVVLSVLVVWGLHTQTSLASATAIYTGQACESGAVTATISWQGSDPTALQQWLDLSPVDGNFSGGNFSSAGPLAASTTSYRWTDLLSESTYFVRVNQQLPGGDWDPSPAFTFTTRACPQPVASTPDTSGPAAADVPSPDVLLTITSSCRILTEPTRVPSGNISLRVRFKNSTSGYVDELTVGGLTANQKLSNPLASGEISEPFAVKKTSDTSASFVNISCSAQAGAKSMDVIIIQKDQMTVLSYAPPR